MSAPLEMLNAVIAVACCLRLILFARCGATHRPWASAMAYLLIVACAALVLGHLLGHPAVPAMAQVVLNLVLAGALFSVRGNVVELFRQVNGNRQSIILRWLRRETWI